MTKKDKYSYGLISVRWNIENNVVFGACFFKNGKFVDFLINKNILDKTVEVFLPFEFDFEYLYLYVDLFKKKKKDEEFWNKEADMGYGVLKMKKTNPFVPGKHKFNKKFMQDIFNVYVNE